jgi:trehalose 6-phosphate phosphatase
VKHALGPEGRAELARLAHGRALSAFDYDGTLAPIVPRPADAAMRGRTRELLAALARRGPVVVVSGRARQDLLPFLAGVPVLEVIGSHGAEAPGGAPSRFAERVRRWRSELEERLRALRGIAIEDKRYSLAVHYRHAEDPAGARRHIAQAGATLAGARVIGGKAVVNFVPEEAPHKGRALWAAAERLGCAGAIYAGDDDTDEDVFAGAPPERLMGIRIGQEADSAAPWFLREQDEVDALLEAMLAARG